MGRGPARRDGADGAVVRELEPEPPLRVGRELRVAGALREPRAQKAPRRVLVEVGVPLDAGAGSPLVEEDVDDRDRRLVLLPGRRRCALRGRFTRPRCYH